MKLKEMVKLIPDDVKISLYEKEIRLWSGQAKNLMDRIGYLHLTGEERVTKAVYESGNIALKIT